MTEPFYEVNTANFDTPTTLGLAALGLEPMLTPKDIATYFRVSVDTLYAWRSTGDAPEAHKVGKHLRFHREDVLAFVASRREA